MSKQYDDQRDPEALGNYYFRHLDAMTREGLYEKAAIAKELAWRDQQIDALAERVRRAEEENSRLRAQIYQLVPAYDGDNNYQPPHVADDGMLEFDLVELPDFNRYTFNGKEYRIFFAVDDKNGDGFCELRSVPDAMLWVAWELQGPRLVEVCVHEAIHACLDNLTEEETDRIAKDVSSFTYRVLLRRDASAKRAHEKWIAGQKEDAARDGAGGGEVGSPQ